MSKSKDPEKLSGTRLVVHLYNEDDYEAISLLQIEKRTEEQEKRLKTLVKKRMERWNASRIM